jgi:tripartite ATP-independent transporter DctM subunit
MATGMPVAFTFLFVSIIGVYTLFGGEAGLRLLIPSIRDSVAIFVLLPMTSFILMGEIMFQSKMAPDMLDALDKWLGRLPGRLGLLAVGGGTLFSTLTGVSMASVAMLGSSLVPEMEARGYKKPMSLGPILGSGGLALMIPPSGLAVLLGALAEISIGKILIAIIIPGILLSVLYTAYIIIRCWLQPSIAPAYSVPPIPLMKKILTTVKYIFPIGIIIFLVIGVIILGIATPTEASALGAFGTFVLVAAYGKLNWQVVKNSLNGTLHTTVMIFMIIVGAKVFSQVLAASGAMQGAIKFTLGLPLSPILILIAMQLVLLFMGTFVTVVSIMLITVPLFMPVVEALGFHPVWFAVLFLLNSEMATTTPPFGLSLFVMKGVAPPDTAMEDIYRAGLPFLGCDLIAMILIIAFPGIALWLPAVMK